LALHSGSAANAAEQDIARTNEISLLILMRSNVEVTGAARIYRAASSDRREHDRPQGYASWSSVFASSDVG
jgi:hypothetical protein